MPAQPFICHNTAEPTVCLLRLLYACLGCCMLAHAAICLLSLLPPPMSRAPRARLCRAPSAQRPALAPCPWRAVLYCNTAQPFSLACHNCIAIQCPAKPAPSHNTISVLQHSPNCQALPIVLQSQPTAHLLQYTSLYCNQPLQPPSLLTCLLQYNAIKLHTQVVIQFFQPSLLQYNCKVAIQFFFSQYNWAVAQFRSALFFHSFFFISSSYWKTLKIHTYFFFFHFPEYTNKFIKIYFIQFSSILQLVKP